MQNQLMHIPSATCRIQFNSSFGFEAAKKILHYLYLLGISDIYASPISKAREGSTHCYDVADPNQLNPELGAVEEFEGLVRELKNHAMGWLQDIAPNHMAYSYQNRMLMDILENGQHSRYYNFFDIDWNHHCEGMSGRLLAPFLGKLYCECLENGEIKLRYDRDGLIINYSSLGFPVKIESYTRFLTYDLDGLKKVPGEHHPDLMKINEILEALYILKNLPADEKGRERYERVTFIKKTLWQLYKESPEIKGFIDKNIETFNGERGNPQSFNLLDTLLSEQLFRLSFWKVATEEINYRRFFNINDLICMKMENKNVFDHAHSLIFKLIEEKKITGLRIDHIDGLYDPAEYLKRVRERSGNVYMTVEKILDLKEKLPSSWPVQGTTGYDFLNYVNGVFCNGENKSRFDRIYSEFTGSSTRYKDIVCEKKRLILEKHMAGDVDNLAHLIKRISSRYRYGNDITQCRIKRALVEIMVHFPVYRTYISCNGMGGTDRSNIREAVDNAKRTDPELLNEFDFIERLILTGFGNGNYPGKDERNQWIHFIMTFQQFTGPLMAKGFEDTVLYVYDRLLSLNEVGGNPDQFGILLEEFHKFNMNRAKLWPHSINATSTHDTKRGEDARARINVLSEMPDEWEMRIKVWRRMNIIKKRTLNGEEIPDRNDEYFLYQTLIGSLPSDYVKYPAFMERLKNYIIKAAREAGIHTSWLKQNPEYEGGFISFIEEILKPTEENQFPGDFLRFQRKVAYYGIHNSLSQTLIKITSPGIPDLYQGTELWDLNFVDPDNRRPVDFEERKTLLWEIRDRVQMDILNLISELLSTAEDGRIKLFLIYRALGIRREKKELFQEGDYIPLKTGGRYKDHIIAFARDHGNAWAVTVAPRFLTPLIDEGQYPLGIEVWHDTCIFIPEGAPCLWKDAITAQTIRGEKTLMIGEVLRYFPAALLMSEG